MHSIRLVTGLHVALLLACAPKAPGDGRSGDDLYVSPDGTPSGSGTLANPYDLTSALAGHVGRPGDTIWLREGDYVIGHLDTRIAGEPGRPITFRQRSGEKARVNGSLTLFESAGHVVFRDFELFGSDTNRLSAQTNMGFDPTDIRPVSGVACFAPNMSFINLVVHDHTRHGFYISEAATNTLVYGCLVFNNGWASPDNADGHNFYVQSDRGTRALMENIAFNPTGANFHIYDNANGRRLTGVTLEGNVAFHAAALQGARPFRDWIVGVDPPAVNADRIVLKSNMGYFAGGVVALDQVQIGRLGANGSVALLDNYLPQGLCLNNWSIAAVSGNLFATQTTNPIVQLNQTHVSLAAAWDNNRYACLAADEPFLIDALPRDFSEWKTDTGFDANSTHWVGPPDGTRVFVRTNRYEAGRAHLVVYNWENLSSVPVEIGTALPLGASYQVLNAQDPLAPPVLTGVYGGEPLELPMTGLTMAAPNGPLRNPPPTGPTFNAFVLLPCRSRLGIQPATGAVELSWPTNCGPDLLQSKDAMSAATSWSDAATEAAVVGDRYVVTNSTAPATKYYRLRSR